MKHINITNWQGNITDWTKFNYIYGGLDDTLADRVNLRIPGTNLRNYIKKSDNLINYKDINDPRFFTDLGDGSFKIDWRGAVYTITLPYSSFKANTQYTLTLTCESGKKWWAYNMSWNYTDGTSEKFTENQGLNYGTYSYKSNSNKTLSSITWVINFDADFYGLMLNEGQPKSYEPYGPMLLFENIATYTFTGNETFTKVNKSYGTNVLDSSIKQLASNTDVINASLPGYTPDSANNVYNGVNNNTISGIVAGTPTKFRVYSSTINSPTEAQSALAGKTLTYELNTPKVTVFNQVDLGTLNWTKYTITEGTMFRGEINDIATITNGTIVANVSCANYPTVSATTRADGTCYVQSNQSAIDIIDSNYNDVATFKTAMSGVILIYEAKGSSSANTLSMARPMQLQNNVEDITDNMSVDELLEPANEER